jgi:hypothetical protein
VCGLGVAYPCPAGRYGSTSGQASADCSGYCAEGYYCPEGSTVSTQSPCGGPDVFCPPGMQSPLPVSIGYYTSQYLYCGIGQINACLMSTVIFFSWIT